MLKKINAAWNVFKAGQVVANPAAWKKGQVHANQITAVLVALVYLARAFDVQIPIDEDTLGGIAVGLFALVNWLFTVVSTDKIGVLGNVPAVAAPEDRGQGDLPGGGAN